LKSGSGFASLSSLFFYLRLSPLRVFACSGGANGASNPLQEQQAGGIGEKNPGRSGFPLARSLWEIFGWQQPIV
jgi:hypothetical protein